MNKTKTLTATLVILLLIAFSLLPKDKEFCVKNVITPTEIQLNNNEILKFDLRFYLNSKLVIFDKTEIRLNKSMFKLSDFNFYTPITEKQFVVKNTMT